LPGHPVSGEEAEDRKLLAQLTVACPEMTNWLPLLETSPSF
jgi:hypothetical protein